MDLSTTYLGLSLPHPLMPGASPLVDDLDMVKRLEDAGAAAIVMHSLFEEQITEERAQTLRQIEAHTESFSEAPSYFPCCRAHRRGCDQSRHGQGSCSSAGVSAGPGRTGAPQHDS